MQKVLAKELGIDNIRFLIRLWGILTTHKFDMGNTGFTLGDIYRLPYDGGSFDAVVASELVEHLDSPAEAFREFHRVIRPDGTLIISTPYREKIEYTLCIHCKKKPVNAHLHSFDEEKMKDILADAGFTVRRTILFVSRPAERLGLAGITSRAPHVFWYTIDSVLCGLFGRQSFMAVQAVRI